MPKQDSYVINVDSGRIAIIVGVLNISQEIIGIGVLWQPLDTKSNSYTSE